MTVSAFMKNDILFIGHSQSLWNVWLETYDGHYYQYVKSASFDNSCVGFAGAFPEFDIAGPHIKYFGFRLYYLMLG